MMTKIKVEGSENEHPARGVYELVSETMSRFGYIGSDLVEILSDGDVGITLEMSEYVDNLIRDGRFPFTLQKHMKGYFGESTGSSNVTTVRLRDKMSLEEAIEVLHETGQLKQALRVIREARTPDDPAAGIILAYAIAQYAKGWLAEELISETDWFNKGSVAHDEGGIDGYAHGHTAQIGSITRYNSAKKKMEASEHRQLLYQWHSDGYLYVADLDECLDMNNLIAKDANLSATLIRKSDPRLKAAKQKGRAFRYLWW